MKSYKQLTVAERGKASLPRDETMTACPTLVGSPRNIQHASHTERIQQIVFICLCLCVHVCMYAYIII